jgi:hypothetical protein
VNRGKQQALAPKPSTVAEPSAPQATGILKRVGGSRSDDWNNRIITDTTQVLWIKNSDQKEYGQQINAALVGLIGISPKDELEGMMAAQLIAAHCAAMECYRRAMLGEQTFEGRRENLSQANKLSRTYATLLEALNRHRGKAQQKVTVEHVHVHSGGQAIVGAVTNAGRGGTATPIGELNDKQIADASERPMWCADPERDHVPISCDAERPLPDARWEVTGSAKR